MTTLLQLLHSGSGLLAQVLSRSRAGSRIQVFFTIFSLRLSIVDSLWSIVSFTTPSPRTPIRGPRLRQPSRTVRTVDSGVRRNDANAFHIALCFPLFALSFTLHALPSSQLCALSSTPQKLSALMLFASSFPPRRIPPPLPALCSALFPLEVAALADAESVAEVQLPAAAAAAFDEVALFE